MLEVCSKRSRPLVERFYRADLIGTRPNGVDVELAGLFGAREDTGGAYLQRTPDPVWNNREQIGGFTHVATNFNRLDGWSFCRFHLRLWR